MKSIKLRYIAILILLFPVILKSQDVQVNESCVVKLKVNAVLPVGWGYRNSGIVLKNISGDSRELGDTIRFGITAGSEYERMYKDSIYFIRFINSNKQNKLDYSPAINGCVSNKNEIWYIAAAFPVKSNDSDKDIFTGYAINSEGKAQFVWDMALSESFYVDGLKKWDEKYLNKRLIIQGNLKTIIDGIYSGNIITDWEIINID